MQFIQAAPLRSYPNIAAEGLFGLVGSMHYTDHQLLPVHQQCSHCIQADLHHTIGEEARA